MPRHAASLIRRIYNSVPFLRKARALQRRSTAGIKSHIQALSQSKDNAHALSSLIESRRQGRDDSPSHDKDLPTSVDVTIVTYNSLKWIDPFLESIRKQKFPTRRLKLVFVDHGSSDGTVAKIRAATEHIRDEFSSVKIIQQENLGFGAGHDRAIAESESEFILITNIDVEFTNSSIITAVSVAIRDNDNSAAWELRQIPFEHPKHYDPVSLETNWQSHACVVMRRSAYERVGGYDTKIFMYGEDVELSYRLRSYGYKLKYVPSATIYHHSYTDETSLLKPLQYTGSTFANAAIRIRYGGFRERVFAIWSITRLALQTQQPFPGVRVPLRSNVLKLLKTFGHFRQGKGSSTGAYFPFRGFDYELLRHGSAYRYLAPTRSPLVSIITRTFERPGQNLHLYECGKSIANQTYQNIQWVIAKDGPGEIDRELEMIRRQARWLRVSVLHLEKKGRSHAGNAGLAASEGEFCIFLDDDDLLYADHVETLIAELLENESAAAAYSLSFEVRQSTSEEGANAITYELAEAFQQRWDFAVLMKHNFIPIQCIAFRRSLYVERGGFDVSLEQLEDWNLWLRYGFGNEFLYINKTTSMFFTPHEKSVRDKRHLALHSAYDKAKLSAIHKFGS